MAGIGFRLKELTRGESIVRHSVAYFYSALIVAGPWLFSMMIIFTLTYLRPRNLSTFDVVYFRTALVYCLAFSLITTGGLFMPLGRYLADRLFEKDLEAIVPVFNSCSLFTVGMELIFSALFFLFADGLPLIKLLIIMIYLGSSLIWVLSSFLTILRDFVAIGWAFLIGGVVAVVCCRWWGYYFEMAGYLAGFALGWIAILSVLASRIFVEFRSLVVVNRSLFVVLSKGYLVFAGLFYMIGAWIDKLVLWASPGAVVVTNFFRISPDYDSATFFATLTIIPALAIFLIYVETEFYDYYKLYYQGVLKRDSLEEIRRARAEMVASLRRGIWILVRNQAVVTLAMVVFAPQIVHFFLLREPVIPIVRIAALGAFCLSLFLVFFTLISYFDYVKSCMLLALLFATTNGLFTWISVRFFPDYLGYGYFCSTSVSMAAAFLTLRWGVSRLEYHTFGTQKVMPIEG